MRSYVAYGLYFSSPIPLPELYDEEREANVTIYFGSVARPSPPSSGATQWACMSTREACVVVKRVGAFLIRDGREIVVDPLPEAEAAEVRLCLLGPALALLLHQRGHLVLHASAVAFRAGAAVFVGDSGWGKSTLAAALHRRGSVIVADDAVAIAVSPETRNGERPRIIPGFPQLKLWPEAAAALGYAPEELPRLHGRIEKRVLEADREFLRAPLPLKAIYVLTQGQTHAVDPLGARDALPELLRHSYCAPLLPAADAPAHFIRCALVAARAPVRRLRAQRSFAALSDLARLVERDLNEEA